jgi:arsenate reductase
MAAALLHHHAQGHIVVRSAGSAPRADSINPAVIDAMRELDIDLTNEFPNPSPKLDDPSGKTIEQIRPIRDEIEHRIHNLLADLLPTNQ